MTDKNQLWKFTKCQIRTITIDYSIQRSKQLRDLGKIILERLDILEKSIDSDTKSNSPEYLNYIKTKGEWEKLIKKRTNSIILR